MIDNSTNDFDPRSYWETRLNTRFDLTGVGFRRKSVAFNRWVYRVRTELMDGLLVSNKWPVRGKNVLDVGCGTGYFIDYWLAREAASVTGIDIAEISITRLRERFPQATFRLADLSDPGFSPEGTYDYITVFDVLFHIIDDTKFENAVANLARCCKPGSKVFITDLFGKDTFAGVQHCRNRSLDTYIAAFSRHGFRLKSKTPLFFTLLPPSGLSNTILRWGGILLWEAITFLTRWSFFGYIIGATLYGIDSVLRKIFRRGPGGYLALFEYSQH